MNTTVMNGAVMEEKETVFYQRFSSLCIKNAMRQMCLCLRWWYGLVELHAREPWQLFVETMLARAQEIKFKTAKAWIVHIGNAKSSTEPRQWSQRFSEIQRSSVSSVMSTHGVSSDCCRQMLVRSCVRTASYLVLRAIVQDNCNINGYLGTIGVRGDGVGHLNRM